MSSLLHNFWFIQSIGLVALVFTIFAWNAKTRKKILELQAISVLISVAQYMLLGAFTGAATQVVTISRNIVFSKKGEKRWASYAIWPYVFIFLAVLVLVFFWQGWISLLPVIGIIVGTLGMFKDKPKQMRIFVLSTALVWIPYNLIVGSYTGFVSDLISYTALIVGMIRLDRKKSTVIK